MKTKQEKREQVGVLKEKMPAASITVFTTFAPETEKGLSVAEMQELKRALREMDAEYVISKKSLIDIALRDLKYDGLDVYSISGSVGLVMGSGQDTYGVAKKLHTFAKDHPALRFFGAYADGAFIDIDALTEMALMPSRDELIARLLGMVRYPISALAIVLNQIAEQKPVQEAAPVEAEAQTEAPAEEAPVETPVETPAETATSEPSPTETNEQSA